MKKLLLGACMMTGSLGMFMATAAAQDTTTAGQDIKHAAKKTGNAIGKEAKKVGNKTAELASKGTAAVVDNVYKSKQGPDGQTIYIDNKSRYYWVDKKGRKQYITESELKDKSK